MGDGGGFHWPWAGGWESIDKVSEEAIVLERERKRRGHAYINGLKILSRSLSQKYRQSPRGDRP